MDQSADTLSLSPRAIYYLLLWAWNIDEFDDELAVEAAHLHRPIDLLYLMLARGCARLVRRGMDREYREERYVGPSIRGRLEVAETIRLDRGYGRTAASSAEFLSPDCPQNRLLKYCLLVASVQPRLDPMVRESCRIVANAFPLRSSGSRVDAIADLRSARVHRNNRDYGVLLCIARLILRSTVPSAADSDHLLPFTRARLERLFELFLRNALRRLLHDKAEVKAETVRWNNDSDFGSSLMPRMRTDLTIRAAESCMVIDAKYYKEPFTEHASGKTLLRSAHLYQIYSYAINLEKTDPQQRLWRGALAYARAGAPFDLRYELRGIPLRVVGIDLEAEPDVVLAQVMGLWGGTGVSVRH